MLETPPPPTQNLSWLRRLIAKLAYYLVGIIWYSCPKQYCNLCNLAQYNHQPVVIACWHDGIIFLPFMWRANRFSALAFMASTHKDGQMLAHYMQQFRLTPILGSQKKDGAKALIQMIRLFKQRFWLMITPDGPKGPRHQIHDGVIFLAQKCNVPIIAIRVEYQGFTIHQSWDKIKFPRPFSTIIFEYTALNPNDDNIKHQLQTALGDY